MKHLKEENKSTEDYTYKARPFNGGNVSIITKQMADWIGSAFARVNIYFNTMSTTERRQSPSYGLEQLWADIGGVLGLWVGLSVLTLVDVLSRILDTTETDKNEGNKEVR